jgi:hypothetical protein
VMLERAAAGVRPHGAAHLPKEGHCRLNLIGMDRLRLGAGAWPHAIG